MQVVVFVDEVEQSQQNKSGVLTLAGDMEKPHGCSLTVKKHVPSLDEWESWGY